ncbi:MAG TPA: alpha/beta hydrolase [Chitinophagaceae bacterium]|nr:alpha/beta hydrolase [Chitinophagaceae bacterium]
MKTVLKRILLVLVIIIAVVFLAFRLSPYPAVWIFRYTFNKEAVRVNKELEKYVPDSITTVSNIHYDQNDPDAYMDAYYPIHSIKSTIKLPVIVWTHGGGLISGDKEQLRNYCKILAGKGYLVISIDYSIAPKGKYPTPIRQLNNALAYISSNSENLPIDTSFIVLAGDSGGSMIAAAAANVITSPAYANRTKVQPGLHPSQLKGLLLYCGIYEIDNLKTEGFFGAFLKTVTWAYFGKKDISNDPYVKSASVTNFLTASFPPSFISAGNNDPLLNQSKLLASKLSALNVPIDTLFYPGNYTPALEHEYQFTLDQAGKNALERSITFLRSIENHR